MPSGNYRFTEGPVNVSPNTAGTDGHNAVVNWVDEREGRSFRKTKWEDDVFEAALSWEDGDTEASNDLMRLCGPAVAVERI